MVENNLKDIRLVIGCTTSGFTDSKKTAEEVIDICKFSGFYGIEGYDEGFFANKSLTELQKMGELFKSAGLSIDTFHLPYKDQIMDNIASLYETDRRRVEEKMKQWIEKAAASGSTIGILHPTSSKDYNVDIEGVDRFYAQAGKTLQNLLKFGEQFNFRIALENMLPHSGGHFGSRNEHLLKLYEENRHPNLGFCLDTGHSLIANGPKAMSTYDAMKKHLIAFHLQDDAGDKDSHLQPGKGNYFWKELFTQLNQTGFTGNVCVEAPPFTFGPNYSKEAWKKMFAELNELVEKSLQ